MHLLTLIFKDIRRREHTLRPGQRSTKQRAFPGERKNKYFFVGAQRRKHPEPRNKTPEPRRGQASAFKTPSQASAIKPPTMPAQ